MRRRYGSLGFKRRSDRGTCIYHLCSKYKLCSSHVAHIIPILRSDFAREARSVDGDSAYIYHTDNSKTFGASSPA